MKTILVPTDFSSNASNALNYAIELAKKAESKIILLHCYRINYSDAYKYLAYDVINSEPETERKNSDKLLKTQALKIEHAGSIEYECINKEDFAVDAILETIKEKEVDLVVMGTKGASGIKEIIIGSNTARVIEKASCPVIAVPERTTTKNIKRITYATDYHSSDFTFIKKLLEIAVPFKAQINFLHISHKENEDQHELMRMFIYEVNKKTHYPNISYQIITGKNVTTELEEYIKKESPDLIVMSTRQRDLIDRFFNKSITQQLAYHSNVPLMAFHYNIREAIIT